jgi:tetratricopeptide (TPR) repeat protein
LTLRREATAAAHQALDLAQSAGLDALFAMAAANLAGDYWRHGQVDEAEQMARTALPVFRRIGEQVKESSLITLLAVIRQFRGESVEAAETYLEGFRFATEAGSLHWAGVNLANYSLAMRELGRWEQAEEKFHEAAHLAQQDGDTEFHAFCLLNIAICERHRDAWDQAEQRLSRVLTIYESTGNTSKQAEAMRELAWNSMCAGRVFQSRARHVRALELARVADNNAQLRETLPVTIYTHCLLYDLTALPRLLDELTAAGNHESLTVRESVALAYRGLQCALAGAIDPAGRVLPGLVVQDIEAAIVAFESAAAKNTPGELSVLISRGRDMVSAWREAQAVGFSHCLYGGMPAQFIHAPARARLLAHLRTTAPQTYLALQRNTALFEAMSDGAEVFLAADWTDDPTT